MMNKTKTRFGAWKLLAVLPVAAALLSFGYRTENGSKTDKLDADIKLTVKEVVPIPDGRYVGPGYTDWIKNGRIVSRTLTWEEDDVIPGMKYLGVPQEEVEKVNTLIGSKDEVEEAMKKLQGEYRYVEMTQMHADEHDGFYKDNVGNVIWELSYTNDSQTWLAYKQQGKAYYTEAHFDGGEEAMNQWIETHLRYPEEALRDSKEKTVKMVFVVDEEGNIHNPICPNSPHINGFILNAMNMISNMPRWKPATFMNKPVSFRVYLPVTFKPQK